MGIHHKKHFHRHAVFFDFDDNLPAGTYVYEIYQSIGNCSFSYEIKFEILSSEESNTNGIGEIISMQSVSENGIAIEVDSCELCVADGDKANIGWWIDADDGIIIYGKFSFNREVTADEADNAFHGCTISKLVDGAYVELTWDDCSQEEYTDLEGNFCLNVDDTLPAGTYKYEIQQYIGYSNCSYEIIFELY